MMEDEFYSSIKLTSGEELIAKVSYLPDEDCLLVENPKVVEKLSKRKNNKQVEGFILHDWLQSTYDNLFVIKMRDVITMTELDEKIELFYLSHIKHYATSNEDEASISIKANNFSKEMGYLGSVTKVKKFLEDIYKKS